MKTFLPKVNLDQRKWHIIDATGAVGPQINLTPWSGNQYRPRVAWDGSNFIVTYQDQKNRIALNTLDQLEMT